MSLQNSIPLTKVANMVKNEEQRNPTDRRLDALIRLLVEVNKDRGKKLSEPEAALILTSAGLTPTEVAKILGKKSATQISSYLYGKK